MRPRGTRWNRLDARRMSTSTSSRAFGLASHPHRKSSRKVIPNHVFGSAAVACLVLGCAWNLHANVFGASVYPSMSSGNFDAPVMRRSQTVVARTPQSMVNNVFAALPDPAPVISAPAISPLEFNDRFGAAAPQSIESKSQVETPKLALASAPSDVAKPAAAPKLAEAPKPNESPPQPAPVQLAAVTPEPRAADA